jgi:HSP20 family protein
MAREKTLARRERGELERLEPWDTFREMERMIRDFFTSPFPILRTPRWWMREFRGEYIPDIDVKETEREFVLSATIPGMSKDDIDIDVTKDRITISGERKAEEEKPGERYHIREQSYGSFCVSYDLPAEVKPEDVKATYRNGILEVVMPKAEVPETHKVKVEIKE